MGNSTASDSSEKALKWVEWCLGVRFFKWLGGCSGLGQSWSHTGGGKVGSCCETWKRKQKNAGQKRS